MASLNRSQVITASSITGTSAVTTHVTIATGSAAPNLTYVSGFISFPNTNAIHEVLITHTAATFTLGAMKISGNPNVSLILSTSAGTIFTQTGPGGVGLGSIALANTPSVGQAGLIFSRFCIPPLWLLQIKATTSGSFGYALTQEIISQT